MASPNTQPPAPLAPALGYLPVPQSPQSFQGQAPSTPQTPGETKSLMAEVDDTNEKPTSQPNLDGDGDNEQEDEEKRALHSTAAKNWIYVLIIVAYLCALVFAVVHHVYLSQFDGRPIGDFSLNSQKLVNRISNYIGKVVAIFLGIVATTALVQGAWNTVKTEYTSISVIDSMFSLPSPVAVASLVKETKFRLYQLIIISILVQGLVLVSVLAPNALSIDANAFMRNITVPKLDLTTVPVGTYFFWWSGMAEHFTITPARNVWDVPKECGDLCIFDVEYQAPGLSCRPLSPEEISLTPFDAQEFTAGQNWTFYNSTFEIMSRWGADDAPLKLSLVPFTATYSTLGSSHEEIPLNVSQTGPIQGLFCDFRDRTYTATFTYSENIKSIFLEVTSDTNDLNHTCQSWTNLASADCTRYARTASNMSTAFSSVVGGIGSWNQTGIENLWNQLAMSRIVTYREDSDQKSISLNWNLTKTIEGTFEDIVLGILLQSNQTKTQSVLVLEGTVWILDRFDLWIIYGPALFLVLVTGGIGLFWAHTGNIVREKKFSSFLVTTRSTELNALFMQPIHELMASRIKYDTQTGRFLVQGRAERENKQEEEKLQTDSPIFTLIDVPVGSSAEVKDATHDVETQDWTKVTMIASLLVAATFALGHHFFLQALHGDPVESQFWIKNANNAVSHAVSICLGIAAGVSLTQALLAVFAFLIQSWRVLKLHGGSIKTIDGLFNLPSPLATVSLIRYVHQVQVIYLLAIATVIQALAIITAIAPTALGIRTNTYTTKATVPTLDLSKSSTPPRIMVEPPENSWGHVPECANGCTYSIQYDAPALSCRDLRSDEYTVQDYSSTNSTTTSWKFYDLNDHELWGYDEWTIDIPPFIANYVPVSLTSDGSHAPTFETLGARTGSSCQCQDGKYETRFTYKENLITLDTTLSYTNSFTNNCTANLFPLSYECLNYGINALATCQDFAFALQGSLSVDLTNGRSSNSNFRPLILEKIGSYSTNTSGDGNVYFKPKFANLTQALLEYFSNLTVSLIPWLNGTTEMDIEVLDSGSLWDYDPYQLWEVYAPALGAVFLAVLYGLFCIHANSETGRGMDSKFSTLLKTTRNQQLDEMYQKAGDFDNLLRSRLVYAKRGHFMPHPKEKELSEA